MTYTKGEEIFNSISHGVGVIFSIVALTLMIVFAAIYGNAWQVISVAIYGATLVILYTMSTLYHAFTNRKVKSIFQIFDHSSIYLLIAGTYTPYCLVILRQYSYKGWVLFGIIWAIAILGIVLSSVFPKKLKPLNMILYIVMGWAIVIAIPDISRIMSNQNAINGVYWLIGGGIAYTFGIVFYAIKKIPYFHSIWHLFVLLGTICHFISVFGYIL